MSAHEPANALEQRIYELVRPFRNECYEELDPADQIAATNRLVKLERNVLALAQNIAYLAHNHFANTEHNISASNIFVVTRGWDGDEVAAKGGAIAVMVHYPEGIMGVVKATIKTGVSVVDALCTQVDKKIAKIF
ncbi:hypothetical protein ACET3X_004321 [Alternaria dauci]|uniref:Uncharacterized protein n=1 Tax=Alternaria dauci TaxID=48095 RepID=A0ABR3UMK2_9PLEO